MLQNDPEEVEDETEMMVIWESNENKATGLR